MGPAMVVKCFCSTSCNTFNRSRSRWLNSMRSVSIGPSVTHEPGHSLLCKPDILILQRHVMRENRTYWGGHNGSTQHALNVHVEEFTKLNSFQGR